MTSPVETITVECPACSHRYEDWTRGSVNADLDPEIAADKAYMRECATATCPHCAHVADLGVLVVEGDVWTIRLPSHFCGLSDEAQVRHTAECAPAGKHEWADYWQHMFISVGHAPRGSLLSAVADHMTDACYWQAVADAWSDSERSPVSPAMWREFWDAPRPEREKCMSDEERAVLSALPERVTIFRGVDALNRMSGMSWTLDRERAEWFARRHVSPNWPGLVIEGTARRDRIMAYFDARTEREVVIWPRYVYARMLHRAGER